MALSYAFGGDTGQTPDSLARRRKIAETLAARTLSETPRNLGEGISAIGKALIARQMMNEAEGGEAALRTRGDAAFVNATAGLAGGDPQAAASANPSAGLTGSTPIAQTGGGITSGAPSATVADLAPPQRALLDTIAGTESPDYQTMYGGAKFSDFSDHPRQAIPIASGPNAGKTSSAAGRYQFLGSTWDEYKNKLGLPDFSPASQDKAAWALAADTYRQKTGGDINVALAMGTPEALAGVGKALSGTWTSLPGGIEQGQGENRFVSSFRNALGRSGGAPQAAQPLAYTGPQPQAPIPAGFDPSAMIGAAQRAGPANALQDAIANVDPNGPKTNDLVDRGQMRGADPAGLIQTLPYQPMQGAETPSVMPMSSSNQLAPGGYTIPSPAGDPHFHQDGEQIPVQPDGTPQGATPPPPSQGGFGSPAAPTPPNGAAVMAGFGGQQGPTEGLPALPSASGARIAAAVANPPSRTTLAASAQSSPVARVADALSRSLSMGQCIAAPRGVPLETVSASPSSAPASRAQPRTSGGNITALMRAAAEPGLSDGQRSIVETLLKREMDNADPYRKLQLEEAQIDIDQARRAGTKPLEVNGRLVDPRTGRVLADFSEPKLTTVGEGQTVYRSDGSVFAKGETSARPITPQERASWGIPADDKRPYAMEKGRPVVIGGNGTTVNIEQGDGKLPSGYRWTDPDNKTKGVEPIPGGPATQLSAEVAARLGVGDNFLGQLEDGPDGAPGLRTQLKRGDATGLWDTARARNDSSSAQAEIYRKMQSGVDALTRFLTGAGMNIAEADSYARRYLPTYTDTGESAAQKADQLAAEIRAAKSGLLRGRGSEANTPIGPASPVSPSPGQTSNGIRWSVE